MTPLAPRLRLELPPPWRTDNAFLRAADIGDDVSPLLAAMRLGTQRVGTPDLIATLCAPLINRDGSISQVLLASLVIECFAAADLPDSAGWPLNGTIQRDVEIAPGLAADFYHLAIPVESAEFGLAAVAVFTTPNLTLIDDLEPGFRAIAETIHFAVIHPTNQEIS